MPTLFGRTRCFIAFASAPTTTPVWTDVTARLKMHTYTEGRAKRLNRNDPSTAAITLDNKDRALDPTNGSSVYSPNVKLLRRIDLRFEYPWVGRFSNWDMQSTAGLTPTACTLSTQVGIGDKPEMKVNNVTRITATSTSGYNLVTSNITASPGQVWTARIALSRVASATTTTAGLSISWRNAGNTQISASSSAFTTVNGTTGVTEIHITGTAPALTASLQVIVGPKFSGATVSEAFDLHYVVVDTAVSHIVRTLHSGLIRDYPQDRIGWRAERVTLQTADVMGGVLSEIEAPPSFWYFQVTQLDPDIWYRFDDSDTSQLAIASDSSGNGRDGIYNEDVSSTDALILGDSGRSFTFSQDEQPTDSSAPTALQRPRHWIRVGDGSSYRLIPSWTAGQTWSRTIAWVSQVRKQVTNTEIHRFAGGRYCNFGIDNDGTLILETWNSDSDTAATKWASSASNWRDGLTHTIVWTWTITTGGVQTASLTVDGVGISIYQYTVSSYGAPTSRDVASDVTEIIGNTPPDAGFVTANQYSLKGAMDDFVVWSRVLSGAEITALSSSALGGQGEYGGARIGRLLDAAGWPTADRLLDGGQTPLMAAPMDGSIQDALDRVMEAELGTLYMNNGVVRFRDRSGYYRAPKNSPVMTFSDYDDPSVVTYYANPDESGYSADKIINQCGRARVNGTLQVFDDTTSQADYFIRRDVKTDMIFATDQAAKDQAVFIVKRFSIPQYHIDAVAIVAVPGDDLHYQAVYGLDMDDEIIFQRHRAPSNALEQTTLVVQGRTVSQDEGKATATSTMWLDSADTAVYIILDGSQTLATSAKLGW